MTKTPQFHLDKDKGNMIFLIPFMFSSDKKNKKNQCQKIFEQISEALENENDEKKIKKNYDNYKKILYDRFHKYNSVLFNAECYSFAQKNPFCTKCDAEKYVGRNLCDCLSISRKFHDDISQSIPRLELLLGQYTVTFSNLENDSFFNFKMSASLLLNGDKGNECGYLMYHIPISTINENGFGSITKNELDDIILLKHLFYKQRFKCSINGLGPISLQQWTIDFLHEMFKVLKISKFSDFLNEYIYKESAFRYSLVELNNIRNEKNEIISLKNTRDFIDSYHKQLYGILVSDEGWRDTENEAILGMFKNNYWSPRNFSCAIFFGHNAISINQYKGSECKANRRLIIPWMQNYAENFYHQYIDMEPCIPGSSTLTFDAFARIIHKEMIIEKTIEQTDVDKENVEARFAHLSKILQTYSMSLEASHSLEDIISVQFGLENLLNNIRDRYSRESDNRQNNKMRDLTVITAAISLAALFAAFFGIILTILDYKKGFLYNSHNFLSLDFLFDHFNYLGGFSMVIICSLLIILLLSMLFYLVVHLCLKLLKNKREK